MSTEEEIQAKGLTAPRITPQDLEDEIIAEYGFNVGSVLGEVPTLPSVQCMTIVVLVLRNGTCVTGESACVSPENYDHELGLKIARKHAVEKLWPLLGFRLRDRLSN